MNDYHHTNASAFTIEGCRETIGKRATLEFTGEIVDAGESSAGPWVKFKLDERFGFTFECLRLDLDLLKIAA